IGQAGDPAAEQPGAESDAGALGLTLGDGGGEPARPVLDAGVQASRVRAARRAADSQGVPLVINARTDIYLKKIGEPGSRLRESIRRGNLYLEAGGGGGFVPCATDPATIAALWRAISAP